MYRDRRHDRNTPDENEDGEMDVNSSSSDDISNAVRYVPTSSGSPIKVFSPLREERLDASKILL